MSGKEKKEDEMRAKGEGARQTEEKEEEMTEKGVEMRGKKTKEEETRGKGEEGRGGKEKERKKERPEERKGRQRREDDNKRRQVVGRGGMREDGVCAEGRGRRRAEGGPEAEQSMGSQAKFRGLEALGNWRDGRGGHPTRANGRLSLNI
jgi:hypothetical protein